MLNDITDKCITTYKLLRGGKTVRYEVQLNQCPIYVCFVFFKSRQMDNLHDSIFSFFVFDSAKTDRDYCFVIWVSDKGAWPSSNTSEAGRASIFAISLCYIILRINWLCTLRWINHVSYCSLFCRHLLLYSIFLSISLSVSLIFRVYDIWGFWDFLPFSLDLVWWLIYNHLFKPL